jgi:hypothetical protein
MGEKNESIALAKLAAQVGFVSRVGNNGESHYG